MNNYVWFYELKCRRKCGFKSPHTATRLLPALTMIHPCWTLNKSHIHRAWHPTWAWLRHKLSPSKTGPCELSPSFPRLGCHYFNPASGTSIRDQLHLHPHACWGFACSCHLPNFTAIKHWISCSALVLAPIWLCQLLASVAEIRANFQSRSDLGFLSKPICSWLRVIPTTFIAGWDNELLNPQISTTWSSFNSFPLQKVKAASASCVHQPAQQARGLIADSVIFFLKCYCTADIWKAI